MSDQEKAMSYMANHVADDDSIAEGADSLEDAESSEETVAVIGMSGRFPGARNLEEFWRNLKGGREAITFFPDEELAASGVDPSAIHHPRYVKARGVIDGAEMFDASFFGFSPREAEIMDPQHRIFLETAWEALENAGYDAEGYDGLIGVYASVGVNTYAWNNLYANDELIQSIGLYRINISNDKDFLPTQVSYRLNLKGPSVAVQTACSSSLVALHLACASLANYDCDLALVGGSRLLVPLREGYWYDEGGILSPDGHCRAFDARARGTVDGTGVGVVALKRLDSALEDGDHIHALIRGSAINNDGALKVGYTTPSEDGQSEVIAAAQAVADVPPESITYVEAHGTGTSLGDPIEIAALTEAFRAKTEAKGFCAIGSVKASIGHLDAAAGVAGLIKTVLALEHGQIPPSLNFTTPNAGIDFANSPFYVNDALSEWRTNGEPRRAGVSSFGIGGTNAHVVLEEAPPAEASSVGRPFELLLLSAKTATALEAATTNLVGYLEADPGVNVADVAHTLQVGRKSFEHRRFVVCRNAEDASAALRELTAKRVVTGHQEGRDRPVMFLFPGQGAQYVHMARELYRSEAFFRDTIDECSRRLLPFLGRDLRELLYPSREKADEAQKQLAVTSSTQPALFVVEYALARQWMEWGIVPEAMLGHSIGEYVAACLAGVFSLESALRLVAARGRLMEEVPRGSMLSVELGAQETSALLGEGLALAAVNSPSRSVVSGPPAEVEQLRLRLVEQGVETRELVTSHAFHSAMMEPILERFAAEVSKVELCAPRMRYLSNLTGAWITDQQATSPRYWVDHLRRTVQFSAGVEELLKVPGAIFLEVGPGRTLSTFVRQHGGKESKPTAVMSLPHPRDDRSDLEFFLHALGSLWMAGGSPDWAGFRRQERRLRLPLPTYPFDRKRFWVSPKPRDANGSSRAASADSATPTWRPSALEAPASAEERDSPGLVLYDDSGETAEASGPEGLGSKLAARLREGGCDVVTVSRGPGKLRRQGEDAYAVDFERPEEVRDLARQIAAREKTPATVVYLCGLSAESSFARQGLTALMGFLAVVRALGSLEDSEPVDVLLLVPGDPESAGESSMSPDPALILGAFQLVSQEFPRIRCRSVELPVTSARSEAREESWAEAIRSEAQRASGGERMVAYRDGRRWVLGQEAPEDAKGEPPRPQGARPEGSRAEKRPANEVEQRLVVLFREQIGVEEVGMDDDFFELGGDSLVATRTISVINEEFGVELAVSTLFEAPTPAQVASRIANWRAGETEIGSPSELPAVTPDPASRFEPFPLTDMQFAYWIGRNQDFELGSVSTHVYWEREFEPFDPDRFRRALWRLIDRHDMLRAIFLPDGRQQILEEVPRYEVEVLDLRGQNSADAEAKLGAVRKRMSHQVLPSDTWPVFEIRLSRRSEERYRLHTSFDFLIGDAWSTWLINHELSALYNDPDLSLPPLELTFRDCVLAENELEKEEFYQNCLEYWRRRLPELPAAPELPTRKNLEALGPPRFRRLTGRLDPEEWHVLRNRARQAGLTSSGFLLAVFSEILAVWSKHPRFTINLTLFNRLPLHPQMNEIVGDFTSSVLLAVDSSSRTTFEERAQKLQAQLWRDLDHRYVSGVKVLRELARQGGQFSRAYMPVVFTSHLGVAEHVGMATQDESSLEGQGEEVYSIGQTPQVWLDHQVIDFHDGALNFYWDAVEEVFPEGVLQSMFDAYLDLLHRLAREEGWRETTRELVPRSDVEKWAAANDTEAPLPQGCLQGAFFAGIAERPDQPAVISSKLTLSHRELGQQAAWLSGRLRELGVSRNTLVAVVMEKGWEQVVGVLGILGSGAAYLPISADLPEERIHYLLERGQARVVVTQPWLEERLNWPPEVKRVVIRGDADDLEPSAMAALSGAPEQTEDLAYVLFTSGSTGLPKGVMIDHRGPLNTNDDINRRFQVGPADRVFALSSLSFDLSVYDIFGLLAAGGSVVIPDSSVPEPAHWVRLMEEHGVTVWNSVPALMEMLVDYLEGCAKTLPSSLRLVLMSGDWIPVTLPDRIRALGSEIELVSLGGATEASIWSILHPIGEVDPQDPSIPYGKAMVNQRFYVLDSALEPLPAWVAGELYIGGVGLALGYWRDEEKTAAAFFDHPRTGERLYRTGDWGRYLPDGTIEFLGREDTQVKVQGHRIELGEIEATLLQHEGVRSGVVTVVGKRHAQRLAAYVVPDRSEDSGEDSGLVEEIRQFLSQKLPAYMMPAAFLVLEALPLTSNGKVDRQRLPAPEVKRPKAEGVSSEPSTELEKTLAAAWKEVLGLSELGVEDNFFDLGGNSVLMVQVQVKLRAELDRELAMVEMLQHTTIGALARHLGQDSTAEAKPELERSRERSQARRAALRDRSGGARGRGGGARPRRRPNE